MQYFNLDTEVLVCRKSCYNTSDLQIVNNIDESLRISGYIVGWIKLSMLIAGDKVLIYDASQKSFSWKDNLDVNVCELSSSFIILQGCSIVEETSCAESLIAYKEVSEDTMCICSFDNSNKIECYKAKDLFEIAEKEFYSTRDIKERSIYIYTFDRDIDTRDTTIAPRKVELNCGSCNKSDVVLRRILSVSINDKFVLLTRIDNKSMF